MATANTAASASRAHVVRAAISATAHPPRCRGLHSPAPQASPTTDKTSQPQSPINIGPTSSQTSAPKPSQRAASTTSSGIATGAAYAAPRTSSAQAPIVAHGKSRARTRLQPERNWKEELSSLHPTISRALNALTHSWERYLAAEDRPASSKWTTALDKLLKRKPSMETHAPDEVTWYEIKDYLQAGVKLKVLIDVREKDEYACGHIPGAHNVPLHDILPGMLKIERTFIEEERRRTAGAKSSSGAEAAVAAHRKTGSSFDIFAQLYVDNDFDPLRLPSYIFYCSNGVRAKYAHMAAKHDLGFGYRALLYPKSYNEWARFIDHKPDVDDT